MQPINRIVTHVAPHLDEIHAIWMLRRFGETVFPGISQAPVEYWRHEMGGIHHLDHLAQGTLLVGVGGGQFDEHPRDGQERKEGHSAASLVAKTLDLSDDPALTQMLEFVVQNDLKGSRNTFDFASLVNLLHRSYPDDPEAVIAWAGMAIDAHYRQQVQFATLTRQEFEAKAEICLVRGPSGKKIKVAAIESDNDSVAAFARSKAGGYVALVIQRRSRGNTTIMSNKHYQLRLKDLAKMVRIEEQRAKGKVVTSIWKDLEAEGTVPGAEEWFYFQEGEMLLNGSRSHPDVPPTRLTLDRLLELAVIAMSIREFEPTRQDHCRDGICTSTAADSCPWFQWGLSRCRHIRYLMAHPEAKQKQAT